MADNVLGFVDDELVEPVLAIRARAQSAYCGSRQFPLQVGPGDLSRAHGLARDCQHLSVEGLSDNLGL